MFKGKKRWVMPLAAAAVLSSQVFFGSVVQPADAQGSATSMAATDVFDHMEERTFDVRATAAKVLPTQTQLDAANVLAQQVGAGVKFSWNSLFGTPSMVVKDGGYLTGPQSGDAVTIAKGWLKQNAALYGLTAADVDAMKVSRNFAMPGTGLRPVTLQQTFGGIESTQGGRVIVAVASDGKILSVAGDLRPSGTLAGDFVLSAADALNKAKQLLAPAVSYVPLLSGTKNGWNVYDGGDVLPGDQYVKKSVFLTAGEVRPAYRVLFIHELNEGHEVIVDAVTGETLYQRALVDTLVDAGGLVFENFPGAPAGGTQVKKSFRGDAAASPNGWVAPATEAGLTTIGNNADAYANWSNFLVPEGTGLVRPVAVLGQFDYPFLDAWRQTNGQTVPPSYAEDVNSAVTNLFYHHNLFHDYFYKLGWVEGAGNLQATNFGKGGMEGDPILGMAHAGATSGGAPTYTGRDNAYMLTLPDGIPAWSGMFLWEPIAGAFNSPYSDGDYDASIIYHEYSHALSNRYVAGGEALGSHQAGSMGEAWGDWFAMHYLIKNGLEDSPVVGEYATGNSERGIRSWPLDTAPLNYGDIGFDIVGPEVHADGEIWSAILWHVRTALINNLGKAEGEKVVEQLVMDAMPISAPNPSFADMRTAIIAADQARYGGAHYDLLWTAFAQRGLGATASSNGGDDTDPHPAFDHPNAAQNGELVWKVVNADTNQPIENARVIVGQFEARTSEAAKTSANGGAALAMAGGTYDITIQARGFGSRTLENVTIVPGENNQMTIKLAPNLASATNGATIASVSDAAASNPVKLLIDDTEASVFATNADENGFQGAEVVVDLAGDKAVNVSHIQISAFKDVAKNRFATLKDFTVQASVDGTTWTKVLDGNFTMQDPRPAVPDLHYKGYDLAAPVQAKYLKLIAHNAQDVSAQYVQIAELQAFSDKKAKVEPLTLEPEAPFTAEGAIQAGNAGTGIGSLAGVQASLALTQNEFETTQNPAPASQGVDGYVVTLPEAYGDGIHNLELRGPGDASYDLDVYFYDQNFAQIGSIATSGADETGVIPGGTRYIYVGLYTGANVPFVLTAKSPY